MENKCVLLCNQYHKQNREQINHHKDLWALPSLTPATNNFLFICTTLYTWKHTERDFSRLDCFPLSVILWRFTQVVACVPNLPTFIAEKLYICYFDSFHSENPIPDFCTFFYWVVWSFLLLLICRSSFYILEMSYFYFIFNFYLLIFRGRGKE